MDYDRSVPQPASPQPRDSSKAFRTRRYQTIILLLPWLACGGFARGEEPIQIADRLELFIDDFLVARMDPPARLRLHHPVRREIAVLHDQPWEGSGCGYHTVFHDDRGYHMYYHAWHIPVRGEQSRPLTIAYLHSNDGRRWVKPNLGLVEYQGSKANNIILAKINEGNCHDFSAFRDPNPRAAPREEYKAVGYGTKPAGLYAFYSSDAIHWSLYNNGKPVMTGHPFDTQNIAFWDPGIGKYRAYVRDFSEGRRGIMTATSEDFLNWTERVWLQYPGAPKEQLYTNQIKPYHRASHILIGFPARYVDRGWIDATGSLPSLQLRQQRAKTSARYGSAVTDGLLMSSRDGVSFHRWDEAFLRPGMRTLHNWAYGDNYIAWHVVETEPTEDDCPRELSLFATESYFTGNSSRLRRYTLRMDGFASAFAPLSGGELTTKPLTFVGDRLLLNCATSAGGSVRVEIQDGEGEPIEGYALADCGEIFGDFLEYPVRWKGGENVSNLAGSAIRLRFLLRDADVYAFRFVRGDGKP